jgi:hypothetical protein
VAASGRRRGRGGVQQTALRVMLSDTRVMLSDTRVMLSTAPLAVRAAQQGMRARSSAGHSWGSDGLLLAGHTLPTQAGAAGLHLPPSCR